jgi:hypothetical protein
VTSCFVVIKISQWHLKIAQIVAKLKKNSLFEQGAGFDNFRQTIGRCFLETQCYYHFYGVNRNI